MWFSRTAACVGFVLMFPAGSRADFWADNQCPLDKPQPTFKGSAFRLDPKEGTAHQSLKLSDGVNVRLEHSQCEYVSRTYIFILKDAPEDTGVVGWQYRKAVELLSLLEARSAPRLKFSDEKKALDSYARIVSEPKPGVDINIKAPHDQFHELISVAGQAGRHDTRVVVKIRSGPY